MKLVSLQSPYAGDTERNITYARRALLDSIERGEAPFASHLLYPQVLDDALPEKRAWGLERDHSFLAKCDLVAVYMDLGLSAGMNAALKEACKLDIQIVLRHIGV